jgi:hypothetical protein
MEPEKSFLYRLNPAIPLSALWVFIGVAIWFAASPFVGERPELTAVAFAAGGFVVFVIDFGMRFRSDELPSLWRFFSSETGGSFKIYPIWIFGLISTAIGIAFAVGLLPS